MRRTDVIEKVEDKLSDLSVPKHITHIKKVSARVEVTVLINGTPSTIVLRSGITQCELDEKLGVLEQNWALRNQIDIEHLLARKRKSG
jgi:hypothetical protein